MYERAKACDSKICKNYAKTMRKHAARNMQLICINMQIRNVQMICKYMQILLCIYMQEYAKWKCAIIGVYALNALYVLTCRYIIYGYYMQ